MLSCTFTDNCVAFKVLSRNSSLEEFRSDDELEGGGRGLKKNGVLGRGGGGHSTF